MSIKTDNSESDFQLLLEVFKEHQLDPGFIDEVSANGKFLQLEGEQNLFCEGDKAESLFIILRGKCRVMYPQKTGSGTLGFLRQKSFLGEMGLFTQRPRAATVKTVAPTSIFEIPYSAVLKLFEKYPSFKEELQQLSASRNFQNELQSLNPAFKNLANPLFRKLINHIEPCSFDEIETRDNEWIMLKSGRLTVVTDAGRFILKAGDFFCKEQGMVFEEKTADLVLFSQDILASESEFSRFLTEYRYLFVSGDCDLTEDKVPVQRKEQLVRNFPFIPQIDGGDCGAASLCMMFRYLGHDAVLSEVRHLCGADVSGQGLCAAAEHLGFTSTFRRKNFRALLELSLPVIAHWEGNHWLIILGLKDDKVKIADPAAGVYWLPLEEATRLYSGYVCTVSGQVKAERPAIQRENQLMQCLSPFKKVIFPVAVLMLVSVTAEVCVPFAFQKIIDDYSLSDEMALRWLMTFTALAAAGVFICKMLQDWLIHRGATRSENLILDTLLEKWIHLPESFFKGRSFSELRIRLESVFEVRKYLEGVGAKGLFALLELIAVFALLEYYGKALLFALLLVPALALIFYSYYLSRQYIGIFKLSKENFLQSADDITRGIFSIRAANAEDYFSGQQKEAKDKMYEMTYKAKRNLAVCEKGALAIGFMACLLLFYLTGQDFLKGVLSEGELVAVALLSGLALNALYRITLQRRKFGEGVLVYDYLNDVFDTQIEKNDSEIVGSVGELALSEVQLNSQSGTGFSLFLKKSDSLFICGPEKDEFLNGLLHGFPQGQVKLKVDEKEYENPDDLAFYSVLEGHPHIFNCSLLENVALGGEPDSQKVRWCLRLALADHLEERLQYGLKTIMVSGILSYEEQMKVVLARCLYRQRAITILQELSCFLTASEIQIFNYHMKNHLTDRTIIVVDDNSELAAGCTNVALFGGGSLKEQGSFKQLLTEDTIFSRMYNNLKKRKT